ncbi:MAG: NUDIX domain-containing protein [Ilumatobacteraceae bacterium]
MATGPEPDAPPARPAATVVVARDTGHGPEVLLLRRSAVGAFPGLWVFPGGRVDQTDLGTDDEARARVAAAREAAEEARLDLDPSRLRTWSHWTPPADSHRRFATWFFVARVGSEVEAIVDGHEIEEHRWVRLHDRAGLELPIVAPTYVTLHQLAMRRRATDLVELGNPFGVESFETKRTVSGDQMVLLWHGDAGYELGDPSVRGPRHRAVVDGTRVVTYVRDVTPAG